MKISKKNEFKMIYLYKVFIKLIYLSINPLPNPDLLLHIRRKFQINYYRNYNCLNFQDQKPNFSVQIKQTK